MREPVEEFEKFPANPNIVPSILPRDTPVLIAQKWSREAVFNLSGGDLYCGQEESHSLVFLCVPRERAGVLEVRDARLANRGVPGGCCYLGVPVLVVSFPCMLVVLHIPYPYWVGIYYWIPYQGRIVKQNVACFARKIDLVNRTKKVIGQLESALKGLNGDEQCSGILRRLAAARGAINSLMGELMEDHILNHMPKNSKSAEEAAEDMIQIVRTYFK
jgi:DNA-binding FrmR family transcriptional regulator